jgi:hypothetical protein
MGGGDGRRGAFRLAPALPSPWLRLPGPPADTPTMRRVLAMGFVIVAGLTLSACGGTPSAHNAVQVMPQPLIATPPTVPTGALMPVQVAQTQAAQLAVSEVQYATCYAYAGLDGGLTSTTTLVAQTCPTYGLTSVEVQQIQGLLTTA